MFVWIRLLVTWSSPGGLAYSSKVEIYVGAKVLLTALMACLLSPLRLMRGILSTQAFELSDISF